MPKTTWVPRSFDNRQVLNQTQVWNGHGFVLDADRITMIPPFLLGSALAVAATYQIIWAGGFAKAAAKHLLTAKSGATYKMYFLDTSAAAPSLGAEITLSGAPTFLDDVPVVGYDLQFTMVAHTTGLGLIDNSGGTYTVVTGGQSDIVMMAAHLSRIITLSTDGTLAWCVPGIITDWTTTASGAGSTLLNEFVGAQALFVIQNQLVALSSHSVVFGYPTGTLQPLYFSTSATMASICSKTVFKQTSASLFST
jgi:hypothetical protein